MRCGNDSRSYSRGLLALHRSSDIDDLAIAEAAVAGQLIPDAAVDPSGVILAVGIDGRAG